MMNNGINFYEKENSDKLSRIISIELEITKAVFEGHRPYIGDEFRDKREEMNRLRRELKINNK